MLEIARSILVVAAGSGLFTAIAFLIHERVTRSWRLALLEACVVFGILAWFIAEALGAFRAITLAGLLALWGIVAAVSLISAIRLYARGPRRRLSEQMGHVRQTLQSLPAADRWIALYLLVGAFILGLTAFSAAPDTWDSLTYHLSRVMHWQQNQTLAFYPTAIQRQLAFGPMAEIGILHLQILAGNDGLANWVQFLSMLGCVIGASKIAGQLGGKLAAQLFAAFAILTLPMGIMQATSTQNDYVVALWCICFTALVLERHEHGLSSWQVAFTGAALGLAVLTKATALIYLAGIGLWFAVDLLRRVGLKAWQPLAAVLGLAVVVTAPHGLRNTSLYGNPLGTAPGPELGRYTNESFGWQVLASNVLRNAGLELATPFEGLNRQIDAWIQRAHAIIGLDLNDPGTTWEHWRFEVTYAPNEIAASDPLQLILALCAGILVLRFGPARSRIYMLCLLGSTLVFCGLLKWQPWHDRLHLPLFVLAMPVTAAALARVLPGRRIYWPALALAVAALPNLVHNPTRPLTGPNSILSTDRIGQYFAFMPDNRAPYDAAGGMLQAAHCDRIGLVTPFDGREYLVWVTARLYEPNVRIEHILVNNPSRQLAGTFSPCAIIVASRDQDVEKTYQGARFGRVIETKLFNLYLAADTAGIPGNGSTAP
jgi:4-amino-4-deoxy-L-arabinose transferase-like glycosyltransferase